MTIRWTNRLPGFSTALTAKADAVKKPLSAGVDAARAAAKTAHGVETIASDRGLVSARASSQASRANLGQTVDAAAIEVKALLGRMRQIALTGVSASLSQEQRNLLQEEFSMLQAEIDRIALRAGFEHEEDVSEEGLSELRRLSTSALTVGPETARVDSKNESDWSVFRIDTATDAVEDLRDEYGTIEERVDAALAELNTYVESFSHDTLSIQNADEAFEAAQRTRLLMMHQDGVTSGAGSIDLQRSVFALLQ